jgi:hypothetical protein
VTLQGLADRVAQAYGQRAKTDKVDAQMLARMSMALQSQCMTAPSKIQPDLNALAVA